MSIPESFTSRVAVTIVMLLLTWLAKKLTHPFQKRWSSIWINYSHALNGFKIPKFSEDDLAQKVAVFSLLQKFRFHFFYLYRGMVISWFLLCCAVTVLVILMSAEYLNASKTSHSTTPQTEPMSSAAPYIYGFIVFNFLVLVNLRIVLFIREPELKLLDSFLPPEPEEHDESKDKGPGI